MELVKLKASVEPHSPLVLGSGTSVQNVWESHSFIAGGVLRGALAQTILTQTSDADSAFKAVFANELPARFGWLYPFYLPEGNTLNIECEVLPAPCTAIACKVHGERSGVADILCNQIREAIKGMREDKRPLCKECKEKERTERWRGFVARQINSKDICEKPIRGRPLVRVGLSRFTETAEDQVLYVLEALPPQRHLKEEVQQLVFVGSWTMTREQWVQLKSLLDQFLLPEGHGYQLRIGTARARGMGKVVLRCQETKPPKRDEIVQRLKAFQPKNTDGSPADLQHLYFALTARSPILALDDRGLMTTHLSPAVLSAYCQIPLPKGMEPVCKATLVERETLGGWSQVWGMPKLISSGIAVGSVFTYKASAKECDGVIDFLMGVETYGLGERRGEGFGDVAACEPFHVKRDLMRGDS